MQAANIMNTRMWILAAVCHYRRSHWIVEQPGHTVFFQTPEWVQFLSLVPHVRQWLWLGAYGHKMPKPTVLMMSQAAHAFVRRMVRPCSRPLGDPERPAWRRSATGQVSGTKFLKLSENYPEGFAAAMADAFLDWVVNAGPDFPLARLRQSPEEALRHLAHVRHKAFASHPAKHKSPKTFPKHLEWSSTSCPISLRRYNMFLKSL